MMPIQIKDNNWEGILIDDETHLANLQKIAEKPINQLNLDDNPNLLIFPPDLNEYGDKIGEQHVFNLVDNKLKTGNIMGFIGYRNTKVRICSRFTQDDGSDYFLHYMLRKVLALNLFDLKYHADDESIFDFLIYLFPLFLKRALRQGLYKEYQTHQYNDHNVKGRIEVNRHIRLNIPFTGKIAYSTREYAYDNHVTQLIRHTIEYISIHPYNGGILQNDDLTKDAIFQIREATPTYNYNERRKVINQNLRPLSHPYFREYRNLQRLCMQILRHEEIKYGNNDNEIYGVLFDGAWLWEEYLNTFMKDLGFTHPLNKANNVGKMMFSNPRKVLLQPDFFIDKNIVLDAKYKRHESLFEDSQREDRFQLLAYMHVFDAKKSGLIVPLVSSEKRNTEGEIAGRGGEMHLLGMAVDGKTEDFDKYRCYMVSEEKKIVEQIKTIINN